MPALSRHGETDTGVALHRSDPRPADEGSTPPVLAPQTRMADLPHVQDLRSGRPAQHTWDKQNHIDSSEIALGDVGNSWPPSRRRSHVTCGTPCEETAGPTGRCPKGKLVSVD